jgi:ABC-2 type transport system permease protein
MKALRKARAILTVAYAFMVEYRAELIFWVLANSLPFILMGVWMKAAAEGDFGRDPVSFAQYFLAVFLVRQFTVVWVIWEFEQDVLRGRLSPRLLYPIDPGWSYLANHVSERFARLPFTFFLVALFFWLYPASFWIPKWEHLVLGALTIAMAFCLRFAVQYSAAMLSFWVERATAFQSLWFLLYLFLSGMIAPLEVYPDAVREAAMWTPFPWLVYFPTRILLGEATHLGQGILVMAGWFAFFFLLNRILWWRGLRRYSSMGA